MKSSVKINDISNLPVPVDQLPLPEILDVIKDFKKTDFFKKYVDKVYVTLDSLMADTIYFLPKNGYGVPEYTIQELKSVSDALDREQFMFEHIGYASDLGLKLYEVK